MNENKNYDPLMEQEIYEQFYNLKSVASASELTGLTPALPTSEDDAESYAQIYGMPVPDNLEQKYDAEVNKDYGNSNKRNQ